jgi:hypothetical protein
VGHHASFHDIDGARQDGEAFGQAVGRRTAAAMTQADLGGADMTGIGAEGAGTVLAKAASLADAGLDRDLVEAWIDAAADAFRLELDRAASLLAAPGSKH